MISVEMFVKGGQAVKPIRVLVVGMTSAAGDIENFLMAYCGRIDPQRVRFDFLTRYPDAVFASQREAIGKTFTLPQRHDDPVAYYQQIQAFFEQHAGEYDVLWDNECMFNDMTPLQLAADFRIPVRIAHSHHPENVDTTAFGRGMEILHRAQRRMMTWYANVLWASSEESAKWACPAMDIPCAIIPYAIDAQSFRFDADVRTQVRLHYGLENALVVGHVGVMSHQKNQAFLLDAFARLHQREPRARLVLVGDGPDLADLEARAVDLEIASAVLFLGESDELPRLMQAFDLFVTPSHMDGLGTAAIQAQAAGLPCILSDALPRQTAVTPNVTFLPPEDPDVWAETMLDILETPTLRQDTLPLIRRAGYDLEVAALRLTERLEYLAAETPTYRRRFLLTVPDGSKGREDVRTIAADAGFVPLTAASPREIAGKWQQQARQWGHVLRDWGRLFFKLHHGDLLLVQYPVLPQKAVGFLRFALHMVRWKGATTAAFVHSLDSLRVQGGEAARLSDQALLPAFDRIIAPGEKLLNFLHAQGVSRDKLILLPLFDHLTDAPMPERTLSMEVCITGDLRLKKVRYLQRLPRGRIIWHLQGKGWKNSAKHADIRIHSAQEPLQGSFGLIWGGPSIRLCTGADGACLLAALPHRISRFLAEGMPLIAWEGSAAAALIRREGIGLAVGSLTDIPAAIAALSKEDYARMTEAARRLGAQLRRGTMTREALLKIQ